MIYNLIIVLTLLMLFTADYSNSQVRSNSYLVTDTFKINLENKYLLSSTNILPNTEVLILKERILDKKAYNINYQLGYFSLSDTVKYSIFDTITISYLSVQIGLNKIYKNRTLITVKFEQERIKSIVKPENNPLTAENIFGKGIQKSGTIIRGFSVGTNKDFTFKSGLRLQLSGSLSDDIEIVAALTDENTPIQPEGNTERLEELDKVYIQIKHQNAVGTFGDYQLQKKVGEFGVVDRKLQGLLGEINFAGISSYISFASSRGKFHTNNFNGNDGVQGPYRLSGINNERDIIIIAGTEKVFLDGIQLIRGENNDYTIEYSNATITFTPKRIINSASRISVDFEYTDRQFNRNFFGTGVYTKFFKDRLNLRFQYLREGDDQNSPIDILLSDSDKIILNNAGDNRNLAIKPGVKIAEPDSLGIIRGIYIKKDTVIAGNQITYYLYAPGDSNAIYNVSFSFVGEGQGDYLRESLGFYKFVGKGNGSYLPIIFLPIPQLKQLFSFNLISKPFDNLTLDLDLSASSLDKNRFSNIDDNDNSGNAFNFLVKSDKFNLNFGKVNFGKAEFYFRNRYIDEKFISFDRFNEVEFNRNYNIKIQQNVNENLLESGIAFYPIDKMILTSSIGRLRKGNLFSSDRLVNSVRLLEDNKYLFEYNLDYLKSTNFLIKNKWFRHKGNTYFNFWNLKSGIEFFMENKVDKLSNSDSILSGSIKFFEISPYVELLNFYGLKFQTKNSFRQDFLPLRGKFYEESKSFLYSIDLSYSQNRSISSFLNFGLRNKRFSDKFKQIGYLNVQSIVIRNHSRFNIFEKLLNGDFFYEVSTQKSARLQKVFVRVERGTGNFKYLGDINNNGIADDFEFEPTVFDGEYVLISIPTDKLFPVIDLKTSTRLKFDFNFLSDGNRLIDKVLDAISTETFWRIEENSKDTKFSNVYFLKLSTFQNENTTIRGSNIIQQDIFIFENQEDISFRIRFQERKSLNEFSNGFEKGFYQEKSIRVKFRLIEELSNQIDISNTIDNLFATTFSNRVRKITSNFINSDFSYRPTKILEIGFRLKTGRSQDKFPIKPTIVDINSQLLRLNLSFMGIGRLRFEIERNKLSANTAFNQIPFEISGGNLLGINYYWRLNFDYRLSINIQTTISYDGRSQSKSKTIHSLRAEARAFF